MGGRHHGNRVPNVLLSLRRLQSRNSGTGTQSGFYGCKNRGATEVQRRRPVCTANNLTCHPVPQTQVLVTLVAPARSVRAASSTVQASPGTQGPHRVPALMVGS